MCGIFGFAAKDTKQQYSSNVRKEIFFNGMLFNIMRGWDGTGLATVREVNHQGRKAVQSTICKRSIHAVDFFSSKTTIRAIDDFNTNHFVIGHTRSSTRGVNNDINAHPFRYGNIILVHNGTVETAHLPVKAEEAVDSASIAATMDKEGEEKTLELLDGAFSLVWYNQQDDSLNFARNKRKPMAIAFTEKGDMYYSSEWATLYNVLMRNGQTIESMQIPRPFVHYKFFKDDLKDYQKKPFKEYTRPNLPHSIWPTDGATGLPQNKTILSKDTSSGGKDSPATLPADLKMTKEKLDRLNGLLASDHLSIGQMLPVTPTAFSTYPTVSERGVLHGTCFSRKHIKVVLYQINYVVWEAIQKRGMNEEDGKLRTIAARIISARTAGQGKIELICDLQTDWSKRLLRADEQEIGETTDEAKPLFHGPGDKLISKRDFALKVKHGCGECSGDVLCLGDDPFGKDIIWLGESALCTFCQADDTVMTKLGLQAVEEITINDRTH